MPKSSHITPVLKSLHWLKINERVKYKLLSLTYKVLTTHHLNISMTWYLFNLVTTHVLHLWSLLLAHLPAPIWKSQIALLGMLHLVYGTNSPLISASLVRHSLLHFHLSHGCSSSSSSPSSLSPLAFLLLAQYFILNSRLGSSANPFLHRPFPFLPDWFHGLSDHLAASQLVTQSTRHSPKSYDELTGCWNTVLWRVDRPCCDCCDELTARCCRRIDSRTICLDIVMGPDFQKILRKIQRLA